MTLEPVGEAPTPICPPFDEMTYEAFRFTAAAEEDAAVAEDAW